MIHTTVRLKYETPLATSYNHCIFEKVWREIKRKGCAEDDTQVATEISYFKQTLVKISKYIHTANETVSLYK